MRPTAESDPAYVVIWKQCLGGRFPDLPHHYNLATDMLSILQSFNLITVTVQGRGLMVYVAFLVVHLVSFPRPLSFRISLPLSIKKAHWFSMKCRKIEVIILLPLKSACQVFSCTQNT